MHWLSFCGALHFDFTSASQVIFQAGLVLTGLHLGKAKLLKLMNVVHQMLWVCSVQFSSVAQLCPTLWDAMNRSMPGLPVHHQLPEVAQTHVYRVGDAIQQSHPLSFLSLSAFNLSQHQGLFQWVSSLHQLAKVLEFQLQHQSFQMNIQDWFPLELTGLISLQSKGLSRVFSNTRVQNGQFFGIQFLYGPTLTSIHDYWKNNSFD